MRYYARPIAPVRDLSVPCVPMRARVAEMVVSLHRQKGVKV